MRSRVLAAALTLISVVARHAQAADGASELARFVDAQTFGVVVLELEKLDAAAVTAWHAEYFKLIEPDAKEREAAGKQFAEFVDDWSGHLKMLREAGASRLYVVARDAGKGHIPSAAIVVPVAAGKDAAGVERLLREWSGPPGHMSTGVIGGAVVSVEKEQFEVLAAMKPAGAPLSEHLAAALAEQPGAAARVIVLPGGRQLFEADPGSWVGRAREVIEQMEWAVITLDWPPRLAVQATISAKDDAAARSVADALSKTLGGLKETKEVREQLPGGARLLDMLAPEVKGRQVVAGLSSVEVEKLVREEVPAAYARVKEQARRVASMSNMRQLLVGVIMYANDERGRLPPDLAALMKYVKNEAVYRNPRQPERKEGYIYVKPAEARITQIKRPSERIVIYEALDEWKDGVAVGFLDGHVEWIADKARFDELLKAAPKPPEAQPPKE